VWRGKRRTAMVVAVGGVPGPPNTLSVRPCVWLYPFPVGNRYGRKKGTPDGGPLTGRRACGAGSPPARPLVGTPHPAAEQWKAMASMTVRRSIATSWVEARGATRRNEGPKFAQAGCYPRVASAPIRVVRGKESSVLGDCSYSGRTEQKALVPSLDVGDGLISDR